MDSDRYKSYKEYTFHRKMNCERCGAVSSTNKNLSVHHKDENYHNNNLNNLETLCDSCHARVHMTGVKFSKETKEKISKKLQGRIVPEEVRKKISQAVAGEGNGYYGKKHTEEIRTKMRGKRGRRWYRPDGTFYIAFGRKSEQDY